jgi:acetyltransferase-like isoleucine patch superfamily enzyme
MRGSIVSPNIRVRRPDAFEVGEGSVVDDFCYFSTRVRIGRSSHVASGCTVAGGGRFLFTLGDFSSLSSGVKVWCSSNDFVNDLVMIVPEGLDLGATPIEGDVTVGDFTGVGANAVIMPDNQVPDGTVIGALSFVPPRFAFRPWAVYAGSPLRYVRERNRERVLAQAEAVRRFLDSEE